MNRKIMFFLLLIFIGLGIESAVGQKTKTSSSWKTSQQLDKFGDKTDEYELMGIANGLFSNKTVANESLKVYITFTPKTGVILHMKEYDKYFANLYTGYNSNLEVKTPDGRVFSFSMIPRSNGRFFPRDPCWDYQSNFNEFIELLKKESSLKCYIDDANGQSYTFKIDCNGFSRAYNAFLTKNNLDSVPMLHRDLIYNIK